MSTVDELIRRRPELVTLRNSLGQTSLHLACDWPEAMELLLVVDAGLINSLDSLDNSPLAYTCTFPNVAATNILLRNHCSIFDGWSSCKEERSEILDDNSSLIEKFEAFLPRAQSEWEQSSKSWATFWRDFCLDNIDCDPDSSEDANLAYMESIVDLGVLIDEEEVASHQCTWTCSYYFEWPLEGKESRMEEYICPYYDRRGRIVDLLL